MSNRPQPESASASDARRGTGTGPLGMWLLLISLGMLFAASLIGYLVVRARAEAWPPPGNPELPRGLWVSTIVLLISSGTMHWALTSVRRNRQAGLIAGMLITTLLGGVFLVSQGANWYWLISINATVRTGLYMFTFYVLTALHALHILGGLIFLATVTAKSFAGRYSPDYHPGVTYAAMYWHFLDVVWLIMFVLIFLL